MKKAVKRLPAFMLVMVLLFSLTSGVVFAAHPALENLRAQDIPFEIRHVMELEYVGMNKDAEWAVYQRIAIFSQEPIGYESGTRSMLYREVDLRGDWVSTEVYTEYVLYVFPVGTEIMLFSCDWGYAGYLGPAPLTLIEGVYLNAWVYFQRVAQPVTMVYAEMVRGVVSPIELTADLIGRDLSIGGRLTLPEAPGPRTGPNSTLVFIRAEEGGASQDTPAQDPTPPAEQPTRAPGSYGVIINGQEHVFNPAPQNINGRMMLPFRAIGEALGMVVSHESGTVFLYSRDATISHVIGTEQITVNGVVQTFEGMASVIYGGRTLMSVRMLAAALNGDVTWDRNTLTAIIVVPL